MLSISQCKEYLEETNLDDKQVEELRDILYVISENLIDDYLERIYDKEE
jgi:hypothetical protein